MKALNITLPESLFEEIQSGKKRVIKHKRNSRMDKYFEAKTPEGAFINHGYFRISNIKKTPVEWRISLVKYRPEKATRNFTALKLVESKGKTFIRKAVKEAISLRS